jgi:hypothetical protein
MQWTVVAFLLAYVGFAFSDPISPPIPVQDTTPGKRYMPFDPKPKIEWEVFIDLNCPDSNAGWAVVRDVQAHYGSDKLDLVFQHLTVSYHRHALISHQGFFVIENWNPSLSFNYAETILANYTLFLTATTVNKTETQVISDLADFAVSSTGIDRNLFLSDIANHRGHVIGLWKYAVKRGVAAPPTYFVNGVDVVVGQDFVPTFNDWITYFDTLIPPV